LELVKISQLSSDLQLLGSSVGFGGAYFFANQPKALKAQAKEDSLVNTLGLIH
jgi:hypothetical protein